jgi:hypothetical protein
MTRERWAPAYPPEQLRQVFKDSIDRWPIEMVQITWEFAEFEEGRFIEAAVQAANTETKAKKPDVEAAIAARNARIATTEAEQIRLRAIEALESIWEDSAKLPPMSDEEIGAEIQAYRAEARAKETLALSEAEGFAHA